MKTTFLPVEMERPLVREERQYIHYRLRSIWRGNVGGSICFFLISISLGLLALKFDPGKEMYLSAVFSVLFLGGAVAVIATKIPNLKRHADPGQKAVSRRIRVFPLPLVWFQPNKGCRVQLENAAIPPHWSRFFDHLRPIDGDGSLDIEAETCVVGENVFVLTLSNGLSIEKEVLNGLLNTLAMRPLRGLAWYFFIGSSAVLMLFVLNEVLRIFPIAPSLGEFFEVLFVPLLCALTLLVALGIPALYFWHQHKRALERIEAMYAEQGLPERGHERNVGSAGDVP